MSSLRSSAKDKAILEAAYNANPKPDKAARLDIVKRVSLNEKEVQVRIAQARLQHTPYPANCIPQWLQTTLLTCMTSRYGSKIGAKTIDASHVPFPRKRSQPCSTVVCRCSPRPIPCNIAASLPSPVCQTPTRLQDRHRPCPRGSTRPRRQQVQRPSGRVLPSRTRRKRQRPLMFEESRLHLCPALLQPPLSPSSLGKTSHTTFTALLLWGTLQTDCMLACRSRPAVRARTLLGNKRPHSFPNDTP